MQSNADKGLFTFYIIAFKKNVQTMLRSGMHDSVRYNVGKRET